MSRIPCRKCSACGLFSDFTKSICRCSASLENLPVTLIDTDDVTSAEVSEISTDISIYVLVCPTCGTSYYTPNETMRMEKCSNCTKTSIASRVPVLFQDGCDKDSSDTTASTPPPSQPTAGTSDKIRPNRSNGNPTAGFPWLSMLQNMQNAAAAVETETASEQEDDATEVYDEDKGEDDVDWPDGLGTTSKTAKGQSGQAGKNIMFTALKYGHCCFTIPAVEGTRYLLGRAANQGAFLSQDLRVGNEHCYIIYRNGQWYIQDNHSANGTAVNGSDIGYNGEAALYDGYELKLGHHPDSIVFRVTIL